MTTATAATMTNQNKRNNINFDAEEELTGKILLKTTPRQEDSQGWDFPNATFDDVTLDNNRNPIGVWDWPWNKTPPKSGPSSLAMTFDITGLQQTRKEEVKRATIDARNVKDMDQKLEHSEAS